MKKRFWIAAVCLLLPLCLSACGDNSLHYKAVEKKAISYYKKKYGTKADIVDRYKAGNSGLFGYVGVRDRA